MSMFGFRGWKRNKLLLNQLHAHRHGYGTDNLATPKRDQCNGRLTLR